MACAVAYNTLCCAFGQNSNDDIDCVDEMYEIYGIVSGTVFLNETNTKSTKTGKIQDQGPNAVCFCSSHNIIGKSQRKIVSYWTIIFIVVTNFHVLFDYFNGRMILLRVKNADTSCNSIVVDLFLAHLHFWKCVFEKAAKSHEITTKRRNAAPGTKFRRHSAYSYLIYFNSIWICVRSVYYIL